MIQLDAAALSYFQKLLAQQEIAGLGVRMRAHAPGTVNADCKLEFCEPEEVTETDFVIECEGFNIFVDALSAAFLDGTDVSYLVDAAGGQRLLPWPGARANKAAACRGSEK